jgi:Excalibur calcium-binding domain
MGGFSLRRVAVTTCLVCLVSSGCAGLAQQEQADTQASDQSSVPESDVTEPAPVDDAAPIEAAPEVAAVEVVGAVAPAAQVEPAPTAPPAPPPTAVDTAPAPAPVAVAPEAPTIVNSSAGGTSTATIEWSAPVGTSVEVELIASNGTVVNSFVTAESRWEPAGLNEDAEYRVHLTAIDVATGSRSSTAQAGFRTQAPPPPPPPLAESPAADTPTPSDNVYFANCADARGAGAAPLYRGDPGYRGGLDRDNDGVACER